MDDSEAHDRSQQGQQHSDEASTERMGDTVTGIIEDLQNVVRSEVQLARTELKDEATQMGKAAGMIAGGGVLGFTGFHFLMLGLTFLLGKKLPLWLSATLVGAALTGIAAKLGMAGKSQLQATDLKPEQTIESLRKDKEWASQEMSSVADRLRSTTE
jgi:hypothetical protein